MSGEGVADMEDFKIFDSHAHYDDEQFDADRDELFAGFASVGTKNFVTPADCQAAAEGRPKAAADAEDSDGIMPESSPKARVARIVNVGASVHGSLESVALAHRYDFVYAAVGVHPDEAGEVCYCEQNAGSDAGRPEDSAVNPKFARLTPAVCANNFSLMAALAQDDKCLAIGEIGLDYHWNVWPKEVQQEAFKKQWELAFELNKPVIIHSRDAAEDTLEMVREIYQQAQRENREFRAVMHCYSYSPEQAREYLKMGMYFGIGGVITFKNSKKLKETVAELPLDKILLETDCPYLAPEPFRGSRNNSGYLIYVAEKIAEIKGISVAEVYEASYANACRFFGLAE